MFARKWKGKRVGAQVVSKGFGGLWTTTYGRMRLTEKAGRVQGVYGPGGASTIDGKREGKKRIFRYKEPDAAGCTWSARAHVVAVPIAAVPSISGSVVEAPGTFTVSA